jgi:hypothetical protein
MDERRNIQRGRTLLGGKIIFNAGRSVIDCRVRNLTHDGACLDVESQMGITTEFELEITGEEQRRSCKMAWQSDHRLGVSFAPSQAAPQHERKMTRRSRKAPTICCAPRCRPAHPRALHGDAGRRAYADLLRHHRSGAAG